MTFEDYVSGMTVRDMVTHLLCPAFRVTYEENVDAREYMEAVFADKTIKPGSVFLFAGTKEDTVNTVKKLNEMLPTPPLICDDMETSPGGALEGSSVFGPGMAISAAGNAEDAYYCGESSALEGRACGINWSFGPVLDLNINPKNPVVNCRSWGDDPDTVIRYAGAFIRGMQDGGMIATGKHFPGDGMDDRDQHLCTSINSCSREQWMNTYGKVWKAAIDQGIRAIMPGHIALPAFEPDNAVRPATMSRTLLTDLLRGELGFDGLIVSDGMNMGGLATYASTEECIVGTIEAGVDVLLFANFFADISYVADVLERAVESGRLTVERLKQSIYRIWREKERLGLLDGTSHMLEPCPADKLARYAEIPLRVAENSLTLMKNADGVLPLSEKDIKTVIYVNVSNYPPVDDPMEVLFEKAGITLLKYGDGTDNQNVNVLDLPPHDLILLNFRYSGIWGANDIMPAGAKLQRIYEYFFKSPAPEVLICHGSPYIPYTFPYARTVVNSYALTPRSPQALYDALFGKREFLGKCPVKVPFID